jgi:hypothetical protein
MTSVPDPAEPQALARLRRFLFGTVLVGIVGMEAELLLIGHVEEFAQLLPVLLLGLGLAVLVWHLAAASAASVGVLKVLMAAFVLSGFIGIGLHYRGNEEFELEMYPSMSGLELAGKTLTGATPVLAPGSMTLIGLVGLGATYRHPLRRPSPALSFEQETES